MDWPGSKEKAADEPLPLGTAGGAAAGAGAVAGIGDALAGGAPFTAAMISLVSSLTVIDRPLSRF